MSEFDDFLREMAEAKKQKKAQREEANKSLGDFLSVIAEAKAADPKHQMLKEVKGRVQEDIAQLFGQLEQELPVEVGQIDQLVETVQLIDEIESSEVVEQPEVESVQEQVVPEVKPAADQVPMDVIDKYLKRDASFQQPDPDKADPNIKALQDKLKFLEQAIGRIAATGPGGGEVNFRWLDDVNRSTMTELNDNWVLEYDAETGKVQFTNTVGPVEDIITSTASVTSLTEHRVVLVGANGELVDDQNLTFDGTDMVLNGNLTVNGDVTYINTSVLDVTDKNITVAKGAVDAAAADGAGITVDGANAGFTYRADGDKWEVNKDLAPLGDYQLDLGTSTNHFNQLFANNANLSSIKLNTAGPQTALVPGMMAWNAEEDCLDIRHNDGTTLQTGLEQYIRVHNHTGNTINNGTVVMFAGVENTNQIAMPIIGKYIADSTASPLFLIGVLTSSIAANGVGRATTFGYVRDLDTTGSSVGETWMQGDLLWGHPTIAGAMTKVRPTAPNVATSIAAVARVGVTDGQLLVRPTIWPRLYYGDWYDDSSQTAVAANTAYPVKVYHAGAVSGFNVVNDQDIRALNAGRYNFEFSLQLTSSNSSLSKVWIWYRKNGQDVANSATVVTVRENGGKLAPAWNFPVLMDANDTFTLMWATDSVNVSLAAEPATAFCPAIPSVILTVAQTNL